MQGSPCETLGADFSFSFILFFSYFLSIYLLLFKGHPSFTDKNVDIANPARRSVSSTNSTSTQNRINTNSNQKHLVRRHETSNLGEIHIIAILFIHLNHNITNPYYRTGHIQILS